MIKSLPEKLMEDNKKLFAKELKKTQRGGIDSLLKWLEKTDFFLAPASSKHHLDLKGGLCQHSLNVLRLAREFNKTINLEADQDSVVMVCLLHDLCKINYYKTKQVWDKEWKDKTNQWRQTEEWGIEELQPLGHGEKSAILANKYIDLTTEELIAIRWHLGAFEGGTQFSYPTGIPFRKSLDLFPLLKLLIIADLGATLIETKEESKDEQVEINKLF